MASNILSIGTSALAAAQVGISTTGHNIANANTEGYSRQKVTQGAAQAQNFGYGYVGQGTTVTSVTRVFNDLLAKQVVNSQSSSQSINTYKSQLSTIDSMLSDSTAGLNPAMSDFFASLKSVTANASDIPTRQSMMSSAQSLASRLNMMGNRLGEMQSDVNTQISGHVTSVNGYAEQISKLNQAIENSISVFGNTPNDLMDQRDLLVSELSKVIKTTVVPQGQGSYNVFVGNGLPVVVGNDTFKLTTTSSPTDASRLEVGYVSQSKVTVLGKESLVGGVLGGLVQFRSESLDQTQNSLGQIALSLASEFNTQHRAGFDLNGNAGIDLFSIPTPVVSKNTGNTGNATISSAVVTPTSVTSSDYKLKYDGTNYSVIRTADGQSSNFASLPQTVDGLSFNLDSGAMNAGDEFVIRPTKYVADSFKLNFTDPNLLAMAGTSSLGGATVSGGSDNENGILLSKLELSASVQGPNNATVKQSFSSAFAHLVSTVGNKAHELNVTGASEDQILSSAKAALQSESGVNLDEEATNLIRYQQAYQAAGKMMQIATDLFNVLLQLGS